MGDLYGFLDEEDDIEYSDDYYDEDEEIELELLEDIMDFESKLDDDCEEFSASDLEEDDNYYENELYGCIDEEDDY